MLNRFGCRKADEPSKDVVVAAAYMPYDSTSSPPAAEIKNLVDYCHNNGLRLIIGADANAHNVVWGYFLIEYIISSDLYIANKTMNQHL